MSEIKYFEHNGSIYFAEFNEKIGFFTANKYFEGPYCPMHEGYGTTFESAVCNMIDKDNGLSKEKHVMLEIEPNFNNLKWVKNMFYMEDKIIDIRKKFQDNQIKFFFNDDEFIFFYQKLKKEKDAGNINFNVKIKQNNGQYVSTELFFANNKYNIKEIEKPVFDSVIAFG